jgi:transposase
MLEIASKKIIEGLEIEVLELKALVKSLLFEISFLKQENTELKKEVKNLTNKLSLNSKNSSKPPSSDVFVKQTKTLRKKGTKKVGGQQGHSGTTLNMVEIPDFVEIHEVEKCIYCETNLLNSEVFDIEKRQVFDLPPMCLEVTEHQAELKICCTCGKLNKGKFPDSVLAPVQYGNRVKAFCLYFNNYQFIPYERVSETLENFLGVRVNESSIFSYNKELYDNLSITDMILKNSILSSEVLNLDETGFYVNTTRNWLHSYSTENLTYYSHHEKRGKIAMNEIGILPLFNGTGVHDFWKSYFNYDFVHALCNAHHLRELNFVSESEKFDWSDKINDLLLQIKTTVDDAKFLGHHSLNIDILNQYSLNYQSILNDGLLNYPKSDLRKQSKGKNLLDRLINNKDSVLAFMYNFDIPFDNNQAERDIRMMKLKQKISGGFRTQTGADYFCRIRSFISTAKKHGENILQQIFLALENKDYVPQFIL